jgi:two-component system, chemotaxis family, sensor kinase CheA
MNSIQGGRFRTIVVALLLFFGFASLVLLLNVQQVASVPRDARFQALLAAVPLPEVREALQHQAASPLRTRDQFAAAAEQWRDRAARVDAAVAAAVHERPADTDALAQAWSGLKPTVATLAAPAPESFDQIWPDGSRTANPDAQPYREQFADAVAIAEPLAGRLATALTAASAAAEAATQTRVTRLQFFNATALATGLLLLAILIFHVVRNLGTEERAVSMAQRESAHILSTVNEGLFLLDRQLVIGAEHSAVLTRILRREQIAGLSFEALLKDIVPGGTLSTALDFVGLLWSDRVEEELIDDINPLNEVEVHLDDGSGHRDTRYLKFSFKRVSEAGSTAQILAAVTDISEQVRLRAGLEEARAASEAQMDLLMSILHVPPEQLRSFLRDAETSLAMVNARLQEPAAEDAEFRAKIDKIFRVVHSLKSDAAGLGLPTIESKAHVFEDELQALRAKEAIGGGDLLALPIKLDDLLSHFGSIHALVERLGALRSAFDAPGGTMVQPALRLPPGVEIGMDDVQPGAPEPAAPEPPPSIETTQQISAVPPVAAPAPRAAPADHPASIMTEAASGLAQRIGTELGKEIRVEARGLDQLPVALTAKIREILLQLVRNAAVHGIENPAERAASGKQAAGSIQIEVAADPQARTWHLSVEDDGRGLSRERLRTAAVRKGMLTQEQAAALDGIKLIALLFRPGFSTSEEITVHAGRGVGMDIVKTAVEELGGRIGVATKPGRFTRFKISLPMDVADEAAA